MEASYLWLALVIFLIDCDLVKNDEYNVQLRLAQVNSLKMSYYFRGEIYERTNLHHNTNICYVKSTSVNVNFLFLFL